jgi:hypothetical protein
MALFYESLTRNRAMQAFTLLRPPGYKTNRRLRQPKLCSTLRSDYAEFRRDLKLNALNIEQLRLFTCVYACYGELVLWTWDRQPAVVAWRQSRRVRYSDRCHAAPADNLRSRNHPIVFNTCCFASSSSLRREAI